MAHPAGSEASIVSWRHAVDSTGRRRELAVLATEGRRRRDPPGPIDEGCR